QGAPTEAGTYTVNVSLNSNRNYNAASKSATITIGKANATADVAGGAFTYNGDAQGGSGNVKGVKGEDLGASISYAEGGVALQGSPVQAGTYSVTSSFGGNRNYNAASKSAAITIAQADVTMDVVGGTFSYTGDPQGGSGSAKGVKGESLGASVSYAEGSNAMPGAPVDAGTYSVTASFAGNRNYHAGSKSGSVVINSVDPTIDGSADGGVYDGTAKGGTGNVKGVKGEDLGASISYSENGTTLQGAPVDAGSYVMTVSYAATRNYKAASKTAQFTIGQADSAVEMADGTAGYDGGGHGLSAAAKGVGGTNIGAAPITYVDDTTGQATTNPTDAGHYTANASFGGSRNYKASSKAAGLTIGQADASIDSIADPNVSYDGNGHGVSAGVHGNHADELGNAAITYVDETTGQATTDPTDAGTYTVTASFGGNRNYRASNKGGKVTINAIDATITVDADPNISYDGNGHTINGSVKGANNADLGAASITYVDDATGQATTNPTDAGTYTATAKFNGNRNYHAGNKPGKVTIGQVDSTITITGGGTYSGDAQGASVSVKGVKGEDLSAAGVKYAQDGTNDVPYAGAPSDAGVWNVSASHGGNRNYRATNKSGKITIGAANASFDSSLLTDVEYNGMTQETTLDVRGKKGEALALDGAVQYFLSDASGNPTGNAIAPFNVGDYIPTGKITGQICHAVYSNLTITRCYQNYNPGTFKRRHRIHKAHIVVAVTGGPVQYSDQTLVKVKVTGAGNVQNDVNNGGVFSYTLTNSSNQTVAITPTSVTPTNNGGYDVVFTMLYAPGDYTLTANFTPVSPNLLPATGSGGVKITQEDARVTYTGLLYTTTSCSTCSSATVSLSATIQDITAVTGDPAYDANPGDISKAVVDFTVNGVVKAANVPVGLVNSTDTKTGAASANVTLDIGQADGSEFQVGIVVKNYYTRGASNNSDAVVVVAKPIPGLITGGGFLIASNSTGLFNGQPGDTTGLRNNFGFNVKNDNKTGAPKGTINTIIRRQEADGVHVYQVKGNAMTQLTTNTIISTTHPYPTATFNGKASIQDITNPLATVSVDGNATLQVTMTDMGNPSGDKDSIGITVWNKNGGVWFSSNWNGTKTLEQVLKGGNLVVR
ncbi:MAG: MBG domain-containing protein, partial [Acidobacteria bacterium]|nr:MBG domain-containing protein [Acidobacteriota bacterium]